MEVDFPDPSFSPIDKFSPSLANQLMSCPLRVAFSLDPASKHWNRPSTYSALGVAAHKVTELSFTIRLFDADEAVIRQRAEEIWELAIHDAASDLNDKWAPATPPPPKDWPGYSLTRARTVNRAAKQIIKNKETRDKHVEGTGIEIWLTDSESGLHGRADRIDIDGDSTRIVDLKTGLKQGEPTDDQHRQLLLYAVLLQRVKGNWPNSLAIEDATGKQYEIKFEPSDAEAELAKVKRAVVEFNDSVASEDLVTKADPNPDRCRWCPYRVICGPFWEKLTSDWDQRSVFGVVQTTGDSDLGPFAVLKTQSPKDRKDSEIHVGKLSVPLPDGINKVVVVDWQGNSAGGNVHVRWNTLIRTW